MNRPRAWILVLSGLGILDILAMTRVEPDDRPMVLIGSILVLAVVILAVETLRAREPASSDRDSSHEPADGVVGFLALPGVEGRANEVRCEIQAFVSLTHDRPPTSGRSRTRHDLWGRLAVGSIFVGRDGSGWSDHDIAETYQAMERMGRWLEREAARWNAHVNIDLLSTYFLADDAEDDPVELTSALDPYETIVDERDADSKTIASASRAVRSIGFADFPDLIERMGPRIDAECRVWIVHMLRSGRSSAIGPTTPLGLGDGVALCYARDCSNTEPLLGLPYVDPVTVAHEILHLFGATDKYGTSLRSFPTGTVTSRDIMRLDETRLSRLRVDPLTAVEIGWLSPHQLAIQTKKPDGATRTPPGR